MLAGNVGGAAVDGFEHGEVVADVHGRQEAEAADEAAGQVRYDVAVQVGHDHDVEVFRVHDELHARVVDDLVVAFDLRVFLGDFPENIEEHAVAHLEDIGLMDAGDFFAAVGDGVVEGGADDAFAGLARNELDGLDRVVVHLVFDADVQVFRVFAEGDNVDVREGRRHGGIRFGRTDVGVQIVFVAQRDVKGAEALADRRRNRRFQQDPRLFKGGEGGVGNESAVLFVFGGADVEDFIFQGSLGGF